jgi:phosphoadenosine phosphosulfate reductase
LSALAPDEISPGEVAELAAQFEAASLAVILRWAWERFGARATIGTSFQGAGLVIMNEAAKAGLRFPVFTLDTQLLFPETYELKRQLEQRFGIEIEALLPEMTPEQQAAELGPELWKSKPDLCCIVRKVEPLKKKLRTLAMWITGLRRQQSDTRERTQVVELYKFDVLGDRQVLKLNPLATWSRDQVWNYVREHGLPYNPLHDRGFRSIGCWPCTRPVGAGENERAGRWTGFDKAECGIHTFLGESI